MRNHYLIAAFAAVLGLGVLSGCTPEAREKYDAAGDAAGKATQQTADAAATDAAKTGQAVEKGVDAAGEAVKDAGQNAAQAVDNGQTTLAVKNAILTADGIEAKDLNVDTVDNKVILKGSVPTQAQKDQAQKVAEGQVGKGMTVDNQLTVSGG